MEPAGISGGCRPGRRPCRSNTGRQEHAEGRALARLAGDLDPPMMLLNDAVHGGQTQARAFADFLGRKKRIEDMAEDIRSHAAAGVRDAEADKPAWARVE